jgi:2-phosphosulfolactate phosphatase
MLPDTSSETSPAMLVDVVFLPAELKPADRSGKTVVVFDVLRATTSITAALAAGVSEVRVYGSVESAAQMAAGFESPKILCGEVNCLPPSGFDLGNSPAAFERARHENRVAFLSTSNGTKAIIAAQDAAHILIGAIVNAKGVARICVELGLPVTLLCAGTNGRYAMEDVLGAGAVAHFLLALGPIAMTDAALMAIKLFEQAKEKLPQNLRQAQGGKNLIAVGLETDIDFCAALDSIDLVGSVRRDPLRVCVHRRDATL